MFKKAQGLVEYATIAAAVGAAAIAAVTIFSGVLNASVDNFNTAV